MQDWKEDASDRGPGLSHVGRDPQGKAWQSTDRLHDLSSQDKDALRGDQSSETAAPGQHTGFHHTSHNPAHAALVAYAGAPRGTEQEDAASWRSPL